MYFVANNHKSMRTYLMRYSHESMIQQYFKGGGTYGPRMSELNRFPRP